jgi:hypothetical protein
MNPNETTTAIRDRRALFSTLWIFAMLNYLYCDVLGLMSPEMLKGFLAGNVAGLSVTQGFLLGASVLMEVPTAMVLLSRVLKPGANRWANVIAGAFMTIVQLLSLFVGSPAPYYVFFSVIEIACTAFIVWYAWTWSAREAVSAHKVQTTGRI